MGVINITPNSFSDGGKISDIHSCLEKLTEFSRTVSIIDVGAESTAPLNQSISWDEEIYRFKSIFLPALSEFHRMNGFFPRISIDTYKLSTIQYMVSELNQLGIKNIIWNDVAGIVDEQVLQFLKDNQLVDYVFCHNLVPSREVVGSHKNYASETNNIIANVEMRFAQIIDLFLQHGMSHRLYLDPCFGFAKTRDQNYQLIQALSKIISTFPSQKWILGISKKSFLSFAQKKDDFYHREMVHFSLVRHWLKILSAEKIFFRVHDPAVVLLAEQTKDLF
jgi:dihydropteroate synthase